MAIAWKTSGNGPSPSAKQKMKVIAIVISLACFYRGALADDQATPSPTPVYLYRPARPGTLRHQEEIERRRELEAQAKADRRSSCGRSGGS